MLPVQLKVLEIEKELNSLGLIKPGLPEWVHEFPVFTKMNNNDFLDWLQFVFLPNCKNRKRLFKSGHIVLQAKKFLESDIQKGKLLQLLIELDALI